MSNHQTSSSFSAHQNASNSENCKDDATANLCQFIDIDTQPTSANLLKIVEDGEKPCSSKSAAACSKPHVKFNLSDKPFEIADTTKPLLNERPKGPIGFALSDTILTLSNIDSTDFLITSSEDKISENVSEIPLPGRRPDAAHHTTLKSIAGDDSNLTNGNKNYQYFQEFDQINGRSHKDPNNNMVQWLSQSEKKLCQHASYLFRSDNSENVAKTMSLLPREREYAVFNVFVDLAKVFGYRRRRKKAVAFPEEALSNYEQKGDVAGKDRYVPKAKQPYKGVLASNKKRKLSAVYSNWSVKETEFAPRVDRIDDYGKCEHFCERKCIACDCCECCKSSKKPQLETVVEGYTNDLNVASLFLHSHATRTFESAMSSLEFMKLHAFSLTSMTASTSRKLSYRKQRIGLLSTSIWIFGYCIRNMMEMAQTNNSNVSALPTESGFRKVIEQFAGICLSIIESIQIVLQYSHNFYNFCKECIRILKVLQIHLKFKAEFKLRKPLKRGDGLELNRKLSRSDIVKQTSIKVQLARAVPDAKDGEETEDWKDYDDCSGIEKIYSLRQLLSVTLEGANIVQTQLRFLLDDIVDSVKDIAEADLLFLLADMHDRVKFLENIRKTFTTTEMESISKHMTVFCSDFQCFIDVGQHIMKRFVEYRDMIHVTYEYLVNGMKLTALTEMMPENAFQRRKMFSSLCGGGKPKGSSKKIVSRYMPKYCPMDFFRVYYEEGLDVQIYANKFYFSISLGKDKIKEIIPNGAPCRWGDYDSPRLSLEEYMDPEETDDEPVVEEPINIKPILHSSSPVATPRVSLTEEEKGEGPDSSPTPVEADGNTASGATGNNKTKKTTKSSK